MLARAGSIGEARERGNRGHPADETRGRRAGHEILAVGEHQYPRPDHDVVSRELIENRLVETDTGRFALHEHQRYAQPVIRHDVGSPGTAQVVKRAFDSEESGGIAECEQVPEQHLPHALLGGQAHPSTADRVQRLCATAGAWPSMDGIRREHRVTSVHQKIGPNPHARRRETGVNIARFRSPDLKHMSLPRLGRAIRRTVVTALAALPLLAYAQPSEAPPEGWHNLAPANGVEGIDLEGAYVLLASRQPVRTAVVAVIDSGVDIEHPDFEGRIWTNDDEVAGNGVDDDNNGYVDDVHGWNFIGGADGRHVREDTYELTREVARYRSLYAGGDSASASPEDLGRWRRLERELEEKRAETEASLGQLGGIAEVTRDAESRLRDSFGREDYTAADVRALSTDDPQLARAQQVFLLLDANGITPAALFAEVERLEGLLEYGYNPDFNPRSVVGDDPLDYTDRLYGNANVAGPRPDHGTAVAGVIAAVRGNGAGIDGIADNVRIMVVRAVPAGDERDKDVANAIRYAVDNGAHVVNMSFGKAYSPGKAAVDEAIRYAEERGVLVVHAAGNNGEDIDEHDNYPSRRLLGGGTASNWLEVGASTWSPALAASFSNYGRAGVDLFAPGERIYTLEPGGGTASADGTSLAAPVVSGVAALLLSYFPELTPADVRGIIVGSVRAHAETQSTRPGDGAPATFGELSVTGGVLDAAAAVRAAMARVGS